MSLEPETLGIESRNFEEDSLKMETIANPQIPYLQHIGILAVGKTVVIEGMIMPPAQSFIVSFKAGNISPHGDIALQLTAVLLRGLIRRNAFINGSWGKEETNGNFPLTVGKKFQISVKTTPDKYIITVNGDACEFVHRLPSSRVDYLSIQGNIKVYLIQYETSIDDVFPIYNEAPPPSEPAQYPSRLLEEPFFPPNLGAGVALGAIGAIGLGAIGSALFSQKSVNTSGDGRSRIKCNCQNGNCDNCRRNRESAKQEQHSSGLSKFGKGLAIVAAIGAAGGLLYSLTRSDNTEKSDAEESDSD